MVDDILCVGEGDTYESAVKDHDRNLIALLERCREKNIKLNPKKLQLATQEVPYIGHVLTPDGLWNNTHEKSWKQVKQLITREPVLKYSRPQ